MSSWVALVGSCAAAVACSSTTTPPADAFVQGSLSQGANGSRCPLMGAAVGILSIGTPTPNKPTTVQDGGNNGGGSVSISCKVTPSGNGFDIELSAEQSGTDGATLAITSPQGMGAITTSGGTGVTAAFNSATDGQYRSNNCTITPVYQGAMVPVTPAVAGGRIWGHISCPAADNESQSQMTADGGSEPAQCDGEADFLFEQCSQ